MSCVAQQINVDTQTHKTNTQEIEEFEQTANNQSNSQENLSSIFKAVRIIEQVCSIYSTDVNVAILGFPHLQYPNVHVFVAPFVKYAHSWGDFQVSKLMCKKIESLIALCIRCLCPGQGDAAAKTRKQEPANPLSNGSLPLYTNTSRGPCFS